LVDKVIVNDDHTIVTFNIKGGNKVDSIQPVDIKELNAPICGVNTVQMQSPLPCHRHLLPNIIVWKHFL
jgi:hypothetical protein